MISFFLALLSTKSNCQVEIAPGIGVNFISLVTDKDLRGKFGDPLGGMKVYNTSFFPNLELKYWYRKSSLTLTVGYSSFTVPFLDQGIVGLLDVMEFNSLYSSLHYSIYINSFEINLGLSYTMHKDFIAVDIPTGMSRGALANFQQIGLKPGIAYQLGRFSLKLNYDIGLVDFSSTAPLEPANSLLASINYVFKIS